ncbi:hypothetical protein [Salimicrobium halophilum]|uniref:DUF4190 domain-containing protein n=1 Tax=Salimicrobium halophilum TaxID=86666 RepID=A0A1G8R3H5_9BACI|nr:hypothetical protein [Salimicrobium halophilum]SDJ11115.1 hypothetical protein SAMN04490247_0777 [Salimicrobium halophilum]
MKREEESKAVTSLVLGLLSLPVPLLGWLLGLLAIGYARAAMRKMDERNPKRWYAVAGIVSGVVGIVMDLGIVLIALIIYLFL